MWRRSCVWSFRSFSQPWGWRDDVLETDHSWVLTWCARNVGKICLYRRPKESLRDHRGVRGRLHQRSRLGCILNEEREFARGHGRSWKTVSIKGVFQREGMSWRKAAKQFFIGEHTALLNTQVQEIFARLMELFFYLWNLPGFQGFIYALEIPDHCIYLTCGDTKHIFISSFDWSVFFPTPSHLPS